MFDDYKEVNVGKILEDVREDELQFLSEMFSDEIKEHNKGFDDYPLVDAIRRAVVQDHRRKKAQRRKKSIEKLRKKKGLIKHFFGLIGIGEFFEVHDEVLEEIEAEYEEYAGSDFETGKRKVDLNQEALLTTLPFFKVFSKFNLLLAMKKAFTRTDIIIGVDIGSTSFKWVQFKVIKGRVIVFDYEIAEYDTSNVLDAVRKLYSSLMKREIISIADCLISFSDIQVTLFSGTFPKLSKTEFLTALAAKMGKKTSVRLTSPSFEYDVISSIGQGEDILQQMFVGVVESTDLTSKMSLFKNLGFIPAKLSFNTLMLLELAKWLLPKSSTKGMFLLDMGGNKSQLLYIKEKIVKYSADFEIGRNDFKLSLTGGHHVAEGLIEITEERAEEILAELGIPSAESIGQSREGLPASFIRELQKPVMEKLAKEISFAYQGLKSKDENFEVTELFICGGGSGLVNFKEILQQMMILNVKEIPVPDYIAFASTVFSEEDFLRDLPLLLPAISLGLSKQTYMNFLPGNFKNVKKDRLALAAIASAWLIAITGASLASVGIQSKKDDVEKLLIETQKSFGNLSPFISIIDSLSMRKNAVNVSLGNFDASGTKKSPVRNFLKYISTNIPESIAIDELILNEEGYKLDLKGRYIGSSTRPYRYITEFVLMLEKSGYFSTVTSSKNKRPSVANGFAISCQMKGM